MYDHIEVYYGPGKWPSQKIPGPAPLISIAYVPYFAGDNVIGYEYNVTITGYATCPEPKPTAAENAKQVMIRTRELLEQIFNKNGAVLLVQGRTANGGFDGDATELLRAVGSQIKSISLEPNDNLWTNYVNYTVELTFNEIAFHTPCEQGDTPPDVDLCPNIVVTNYPNNYWEDLNGNDLNAIAVHRIKSFSDTWDFNIDDKNYDALGSAIHNERFNISYTITAEGMNRFTGTNTHNSNFNVLIPAWEQAKDFCQRRLYEQLRRLNSGLRIHSSRASFSLDGTDPAANANPEVAFTDITSNDNGIYSFPRSVFKVYNEQVDMTASESAGSYTINYTAIVKKFQTDPGGLNLPEDKDVIHTVNPSKKFTDDGNIRNISLSIDGKIEGLLDSQLVNNPVDYKFQAFKEMLVAINTTGTKYDKAKDYYNLIVRNNSDFTRDFKDYLGITFELFEVSSSDALGPIPSSFNVIHNYSEGTIEYSASFESSRICAGYSNYTNIEVLLTDKIEQVAEIVIPGRTAPGTLVQRLNTYSPRTITLNITGRTNKDCCWDIASYANGVCDVPFVTTFHPRSSPNFGLDNILPPRAMVNAILTSDSNSLDPLTGAFSVTREYTFFDN